MRVPWRRRPSRDGGPHPSFVQRHGLRILDGEEELRAALARMAAGERSLAGALTARADRHEQLLGGTVPDTGAAMVPPPGASSSPADAGGTGAPRDAVPRASGAPVHDPSALRTGTGVREAGGRAVPRPTGCRPGSGTVHPPRSGSGVPLPDATVRGDLIGGSTVGRAVP